jgi:hypothetical protein
MATSLSLKKAHVNAMENPITQTIICMISTLLAWVSLQNVQVVAAIVASIVAAISGILAGVNWWYSIQEKKQTLKKLNK